MNAGDDEGKFGQSLAQPRKKIPGQVVSDVDVRDHGSGRVPGGPDFGLRHGRRQDRLKLGVAQVRFEYVGGLRIVFKEQDRGAMKFGAAGITKSSCCVASPT